MTTKESNEFSEEEVYHVSIAAAELAQQYFPEATKETARKLFTSMVKRNTALQTALESTMFNLSGRMVTPLQREMLFRYLGKP